MPRKTEPRKVKMLKLDMSAGAHRRLEDLQKARKAKSLCAVIKDGMRLLEWYQRNVVSKGEKLCVTKGKDVLEIELIF